MGVSFKGKESNAVKPHTKKEKYKLRKNKRQKKLHFCSGSNRSLFRYFAFWSLLYDLSQNIKDPLPGLLIINLNKAFFGKNYSKYELSTASLLSSTDKKRH